MITKLDQGPTKCLYCKGEILVPKLGKYFCAPKCRYGNHNEKTRRENEEEFGSERKLRHNVKILKKLLLHPFYTQGKRIERSFLEYEGFHFDVITLTSEIREVGKPVRPIIWFHNYGIEAVAKKEVEKKEIQYYTIHINPKTKSHV